MGKGIMAKHDSSDRAWQDIIEQENKLSEADLQLEDAQLKSRRLLTAYRHHLQQAQRTVNAAEGSFRTQPAAFNSLHGDFTYSSRRALYALEEELDQLAQEQQGLEARREELIRAKKILLTEKP